MSFWKRRREKNEPQESVPQPQASVTVRPEEHASPAPAVPKRLISYRVANLQGVGSRERQEDSFTFVNAMDVTEMRRNGLLAIVADGMGGMRDGKVASETAIACMKKDFQAMDRSGDIAAQLRDSVLNAGARVFDSLGGGGGSTVVACIFYEEQLWFASVGDSFLYLLRDGQLLRLNREHNVLHERYLETIRSGSMDPEPARADWEKSALSQFLGMDVLDDVDYLRRPLKLHDGDRFLLCSDGVAGVLSEAALQSYMEKGTPADACAAMEKAILMENRQYQDNFTALVVQCGY